MISRLQVYQCTKIARIRDCTGFSCCTQYRHCPPSLPTGSSQFYTRDFFAISWICVFNFSCTLQVRVFFCVANCFHLHGRPPWWEVRSSVICRPRLEWSVLISVFCSPTIYSPLETEALRRDRLSVSIKRVPLFILPSNIFLALQNVVVVWVPSSTGVQLYMLYFSIFKLQHLLVIGAPDIPTVHFLCRIWPKEIKYVFIPRRPEYSRRGAKMENRGIRPNFYSSVWFLFLLPKTTHTWRNLHFA